MQYCWILFVKKWSFKNMLAITFQHIFIYLEHSSSLSILSDEWQHTDIKRAWCRAATSSSSSSARGASNGTHRGRCTLAGSCFNTQCMGICLQQRGRSRDICSYNDAYSCYLQLHRQPPVSSIRYQPLYHVSNEIWKWWCQNWGCWCWCVQGPLEDADGRKLGRASTSDRIISWASLCPSC